MTRPITAHKGGRTARAPQARIKQATLDNIHTEMTDRKMSFADLLEERWQGDDTMSQTINTSFDPKSLPKWAQNDLAVVEKCKRDLAYRANVCSVKSLNHIGAKQYAEQLKREAH